MMYYFFWCRWVYVSVCVITTHPDTSDVFAHKTDHLVTRLSQILKSINNNKKEYLHSILISISQAIKCYACSRTAKENHQVKGRQRNKKSAKSETGYLSLSLSLPFWKIQWRFAFHLPDARCLLDLWKPIPFKRTFYVKDRSHLTNVLILNWCLLSWASRNGNKSFQVS